MNVCLINYNPSNLFDRNEKLNLLTIGAFLKKSHNISFYEVSDFKKFDIIADFYIVTSREFSVIDFCRMLKEKGRVIYFHEYSDYYIKNPQKNSFDLVVYKNNFGAIFDFIDFFSTTPLNCDGALIQDKDFFILNSSENLLDLKKTGPLPFDLYPEYGIFIESGFKKSAESEGEKTALIYYSKGCTGNCTFCVNPYFYGKKVEYRAEKDVIKDILFFISKGIKYFSFEDADLCHNTQKLSDLSNLIIKNNLKIQFRAHSKASNIKQKNLELLKKAGCIKLDIGLESASCDVAKKCNKPVSCDKILECINLCKEYEIEPYILVMCGFPYETKTDINQTGDFLDLLKKMGVKFGLSFFRPIPGSVDYDIYFDNNEDFSNHKPNVLTFRHPLIENKYLLDFYFKHTGIVARNADLSNDFDNHPLFENNCIKIDIKNFSSGEFKPVALNFWKAEGGKNNSHLVGRFEGYIEYKFRSNDVYKGDFTVSFKACSQTENPSKINLIFNDIINEVEIPPKSEKGELIQINFENVLIENINSILIKTLDNNGISLFEKNSIEIKKRTH